MTDNLVAASGPLISGASGRCGATPDPSARARPVHLQLRGLEHERDDQRHQRGPGHDRQGRADRDHVVPADHGRPDDPVQQADRPLGPQAVLHAGADVVRDRRSDQRGLAEPRGADPRQLGARGRRHCAPDPAGLHPRHVVVHRPHLARLGLRRDQRARRHRRGGRAADRRLDHHGDQLARRVRLPGRRRRA